MVIAAHTGTQRIGLLTSQVQINKWHQVALLVYYYKRVTFYASI